MKLCTLAVLAMALAAVAPVSGTSINSGDSPDLSLTMQRRLSALLDNRTGTLMAGGSRFHTAIGTARAAADDLTTPDAERQDAIAVCVEARLLVRRLEMGGRCHRFYHAPLSTWSLCCSLRGAMLNRTVAGATGSDADAGAGVASRLCLPLSSVKIAAPSEPPVHGKHYIRLSADLPLRPRDPTGAVVVDKTDPKAAELRGWGWVAIAGAAATTAPLQPRRLAVAARPAMLDDRRMPRPALAVTRTEESQIVLPVGGKFRVVLTTGLPCCLALGGPCTTTALREGERQGARRTASPAGHDRRTGLSGTRRPALAN